MSTDSETLSEKKHRWNTNKRCFIPTCRNTSLKKPGLKFFSIRKELQRDWCELARRQCPQHTLRCCMEHINVEEDLENYEKYCLGARPRLKLTATLKNIPQLFQDSEDTKYEKNGRDHLVAKIKSKPKMYLGLPKNYWWLIDFLSKECSCLPLHIIITLFKIKNNHTFMRISDEFEKATSTVRVLFEENVYILATFFQNVIYLPSLCAIKKNLSLKLKMKYSNVRMIVDCFEIEIEEPSNPFRKAQTWSQQKSCQTVKYLIACTPTGFITFISKGYGGRISGKAIACKSGFIDIVPPNSVIIAGRGFKGIQSLLSTKNAKRLCPPSVQSYSKVTKGEVEVIASLRVHIKRVIGRIRQFHMLKAHAVLNRKLLKYLDESVTVACGLINLQNPIKEEKNK